MSLLIPAALILIALGVMLYPLLAARSRLQLRAGGSPTRELEERYRAAVGDLQDIELDRELGNLGESDYLALRERYRGRAAAALVEMAAGQEFSPPPQPSPVEGEGIVLAPRPLRGSARAGDGLVRHAPRGLGRVGVALTGASVVAAVAVLAIGLLYVRLLQQQGAQEPLSRLSVAHAHAVVIDARGGYWVGHHGGLLSSEDGRRWRALGVSGDVMARVASPPGADRILAFGHNLLLESRDAGASWVPLDHDLPGTDVHGAQALGQVIYAYVVGGGVFRSSNGATWERVGPALGGGVSALAALPGETDVLFLATDGSVLRSLDVGRTWGSAAGAGNMALPATVSSIAADVANGALYAATSGGLFRSTTLGSQWVQLPFRGAAVAVGAAAGHVGLVDDQGQFFLSRDGGVTWG